MKQEALDRWHRLGLPEMCGVDLIARYEEPHRHYHSLGHILQCLKQLDSIAMAIPDKSSVELAIWFHDAIYDTHNTDNEMQSASLARLILKDVVPAATESEVCRLVLLTTSHQPELDDINGAAMVDCDLAILASSEADYSKYVSAVREEYLWVEESAWCTGRAAVLGHLLSAKTLFHLQEHVAWEPVARQNLNRELRLLQSSPPTL